MDIVVPFRFIIVIVAVPSSRRKKESKESKGLQLHAPDLSMHMLLRVRQLQGNMVVDYLGRDS